MKMARMSHEHAPATQWQPSKPGKSGPAHIFETAASMDEDAEAAVLAARCNAVSDEVEVTDSSSEGQDDEDAGELDADDWLL
jgi:hypothetical protein